jgi:hypothetical protein
MDDRVIRILHTLAQQHRFAVSVAKTGHSRCVGGGHQCPDDEGSNHSRYRALDGQLQSDEVGSPFPQWTHLPGWFSDNNHDGHIHIGYTAP